MREAALPHFMAATGCPPLHDANCRAEPVNPAMLTASRDGELPSRKPATGCPTCGCASFGKH